MKPEQIKADAIVQGHIFPEPVKVITTAPMDDAIKLIGKGINTNQVYEPVLSQE